ncbi:MAG: cytochrome c biogenesis protein ResB [Actinomycetota bacterium]
MSLETERARSEPRSAEPIRQPRLGPAGWARWAWRRLTSMRTALALLALLALAAVPGSLLPQRGISPADVAGFRERYPTVFPWLDRLGFFEVYSAPWFAAVYLLLLVSLTGCVLPRCRQLWRGWRAGPPAPPPSLARYTERQAWTTTRAASDVLAQAATELRRRRFRVRSEPDAVTAEKGGLRELGNLSFHLSLLVLLVGVAVGSLYGFEGRVIVVEGAGFTNTRTQYDDFVGGPWVDETNLEPFAFTLDSFSARYETSGPQTGTPRDFSAKIAYDADLDGDSRPFEIRVNRPLVVGGTKVFLTGNGYAVDVTVRDGSGEPVFAGPVVFLPLDGNLTSDGVIKVPDARPVELGFEGLFLPTASFEDTGPRSVFPQLLEPQLLLNAWTGDLGLSSGAPQSVYELDTSGMEQVMVDGEPFTQALRVGETMTLPGGQGSVTFDGVSRFANFQIAYDPGKEISLVAALLLLAGLTASLTVRHRRVVVRVRPGSDGTTSVEAGSLGLTRLGPPSGELARITTTIGAPAADDEPTKE